jgi:hypothetical protein
MQDVVAGHGRDAMKPPQFSIANLMVVVGFVAFNVAATQLWSHSSSPSLLSGRFLTSIALQVGLLCLIRSRRSRFLPFWLGFEVFALLAAITTIYLDEASADDPLFKLMDQYYFSTYKWLEGVSTLIADPFLRSSVRTAINAGSNTFASNFLYELISFLPQLVFALIGGVLTKVTIRLWGKRHS